MDAIWFSIIAAMLAVYAVLDGFDFGVGAIHRLVARTDAERRTVLQTIGPVWDGNEVWLIAAGGVLFMAFPAVYATAFSGFYLALMIVLWLLILRGVAIESRHHQENPLWRELWDTVFAISSAILAAAFGATLGNLVRGVPIDEKGLRVMPLFTDFRAGGRAGLFDWYTLLVGGFTLVALAGHGALYLAWRTVGPVHDRSAALVRPAWRATLALWIVATAATAWVQPGVFGNLIARPWSIVLAAMAVGGMAGVPYFMARGREVAAFLSSSAFLFGMATTALAGNYPYWLRSTIDPAHGLTASATVTTRYGAETGLAWWSVAMLLAIGYFAYLFRSMRGKVEADSEEVY